MLSVNSLNPDKTYTIGEHIDISIMFNEEVMLSGSPFLELLLDNGTSKAHYLSGSGTTKLTFRYFVSVRDVSPDLDYNGVFALKLNGGSINASDNNLPAVLALSENPSLATIKDFVIEGISPGIPIFISVWNTSELSEGGSDNKTIKLPLQSDGDYDFTVYWGDGIVNKIKTSNYTSANHTYQTEGVKTLHITGKIKGFRFNNEGDKYKLLNITKAGPLTVKHWET